MLFRIRPTRNEENMKYVYVIEKSEDGSVSAYVPDLPGCTTSGNSVDEVRRSIKDAVASLVNRSGNSAVKG